MARGRLIFNKISDSKQVNDLPDDTARLLFTWLLTHLDSEGRYYGSAQQIRSRVFPRRSDIGNGQIEQYLGAMEDLGLIGRYDVRGEKYLFAPMWELHQVISPSREAPSLHPEPPEDVYNKVLSKSGLTHEELKSKVREYNERIKEYKRRRQGKEKQVDYRSKKYISDSTCPKCKQRNDLCECDEEDVLK